MIQPRMRGRRQGRRAGRRVIRRVLLRGGACMPPPGPRAREDWSETVIPVSRGSEGFDVSPDGSELWTAASDDGSIAIIDVWGKRLVTRLDAHVQGANRLKFTPDGALVFVTSLGSGDLAIFDSKTRKEVKRLKVRARGGRYPDGPGRRSGICGMLGGQLPGNRRSEVVGSHRPAGRRRCAGRADVGGAEVKRKSTKSILAFRFLVFTCCLSGTWLFLFAILLTDPMLFWSALAPSDLRLPMSQVSSFMNFSSFELHSSGTFALPEFLFFRTSPPRL